MSMMSMRGYFVKVEWTKESKLERNLMIIIRPRLTHTKPIMNNGDNDDDGDQSNETIYQHNILNIYQYL